MKDEEAIINGSPVLLSFVETMKELLQHLKMVFPTCMPSLAALAYTEGPLQNDEKSQREMVTMFYSTMKEHEHLLRSKNADELLKQDVLIFQQLDLLKKWQYAKLPTNFKETVWGYIHRLFCLAKAFVKVPTGLMLNIDDAVKSMVSRISKGESLSNMDLGAMSRTILESASASDTSQMEQCMPDLIQSIFTMVPNATTALNNPEALQAIMANVDPAIMGQVGALFKGSG